MSGTKMGGEQASRTNRQRYGEQFHTIIGRKGGSISRGGGFSGDSTKARLAGLKGVESRRQRKLEREAILYAEARKIKTRYYVIWGATSGLAIFVMYYLSITYLK